VQTTPKLDPNTYFSISPGDVAVVGPDGLTECPVFSGASFGCLKDTEMLPQNPFTPASKYRGSVLLDTRHTSGATTFRPATMGGGGWEWQFGERPA
jgi:serine phosphatase RsbU (regulator of sigma subunit)